MSASPYGLWCSRVDILQRNSFLSSTQSPHPPKRWKVSHKYSQTVECTWYPGVIVVPVLVEFLWVEMRGEVSPIGRGAGDVVEGRGVMVRVVVGSGEVIDRGGSAVRGTGGRRDHTERPVET